MSIKEPLHRFGRNYIHSQWDRLSQIVQVLQSPGLPFLFPSTNTSALPPSKSTLSYGNIETFQPV